MDWLRRGSGPHPRPLSRLLRRGRGGFGCWARVWCWFWRLPSPDERDLPVSPLTDWGFCPHPRPCPDSCVAGEGGLVVGRGFGVGFWRLRLPDERDLPVSRLTDWGFCPTPGPVPTPASRERGVWLLGEGLVLVFGGCVCRTSETFRSRLRLIGAFAPPLAPSRLLRRGRGGFGCWARVWCWFWRLRLPDERDLPVSPLTDWGDPWVICGAGRWRRLCCCRLLPVRRTWCIRLLRCRRRSGGRRLRSRPIRRGGSGADRG